MGGVVAAERARDLAPVHLVDPESGVYNASAARRARAGEGLAAYAGLCTGRTTPVLSAAARPVRRGGARRSSLPMVNRNAGAGTRVLIDRLLAESGPPATATSRARTTRWRLVVAQGRADWDRHRIGGLLYGLGFLPIAPEDYDFLLVERRRERPAVRPSSPPCAMIGVRAKIRALGMRPADA